MHNLYNSLRARIYQQGYTAGRVAAHVGLSPQQMSARMRGQVPFTLPEITEIGEFLGFTESDYYVVFIIPQLSRSQK